MTQAQLADKMNVGQSAVSHWEKGNGPAKKYVAMLCSILKCREDELFIQE